MRLVDKRLTFYRKKKELDGAIFLAQKFSLFAEGGSETEMLSSFEEEAAHLAEWAPNGPEMLATIGWVYVNQAKQHDKERGRLSKSMSVIKDKAQL